ncbi:MAG: DUF839 domain-containing protein [Chloroflexaceae bacterium]|nr:DUF839 domain-containing protein [Chloroflexaceae bacterium]
MTHSRRDFLLFLGASALSTGIGLASNRKSTSLAEPISSPDPTSSTAQAPPITLRASQSPLPLNKQLSDTEQMAAHRTYEVLDDLVLPPGYTYDVIGAWGDRVGDSRFGYNNDYIAIVETSPTEALLAINFEYISPKIWLDTYQAVLKQSLPIKEALTALGGGAALNVAALADSDPLKAQLQAIAKEGLIDMGIGIISVRRREDGAWERTYSPQDRRITGISGLEDGRYLKATGPAVAVFSKANKLGYDDGLGEKIIGTLQNCAGGMTPWGTTFSAEENFQTQVSEPVLADGSAASPEYNLLYLSRTNLDGLGNAFGLAGNKYGWMVEVDPSDPNDYGTKHTWLGRFRHEAVALQVTAGKPLAVYSGCDRRGGHLYKFVSQDSVSDPKDKANSRLFENGTLYGARFNPNGTGRWIPLTPETAIDPVLPSQIVPDDREGVQLVLLPNPDRRQPEPVGVTSDDGIRTYKSKFRTLGDLYSGNSTEKQGAILIDAHYAATAAGVTCTARPEDTEIGPDGQLYIAFTSGSSDREGGPDRAVFAGPKGEVPYEYGWIVRLEEADSEPGALSFRWEKFALGGEPAQGGAGFSNPDNVSFDPQGNLWMVTDISTGSHNAPVERRFENMPQRQLLGVFGNNTTWMLPTSGPNLGEAYPFAIAPMETETCGLCFAPNGKTLFLAIQHPGELNGQRQGGAAEKRNIVLKTTSGQEFLQERQVPLGSNWPGKTPNDPPRPAVVAVRRLDGSEIA